MGTHARASIIILCIIIISAAALWVLRRPDNTITIEPTDTTVPTTITKFDEDEIILQQSSNTDTVDRSTYLIDAYTDNEQYYVTADYVEWLSGPESIDAQIADSVCNSAADCYDYPNGYKRNNNPTTYTLPVSPDVNITVQGSLLLDRFHTLLTPGTNNSGTAFTEFIANTSNDPVLWNEFQTLVTNTTGSYDYIPPFKQPKTFVILGITNGIVTDIYEPYQE